MTLRLADRWVWDFWLARDGDTHHLFYLQAPRALGDPELRHWHVSIGHAVSGDLRQWQVLPDALAPASPDRWDDYTTWTGCVLRHDDRWWMFYTGTSRRENGKVQRIGLAVSDDLLSWRRHGTQPLIEADPRWYEVDHEDWYEVAWRDPWVFPDPAGNGFHALITARARDGDPATRGVIAHATSEDLVTWTVRPPVTEPGRFGHLEVPQVERVGDRWRLLFCSPPGPGHPHYGTHLLSADQPLGPYRWESYQPLDADAVGSRYGGRLVDTATGWQLLAWRQHGPEGFLGELPDPVPVRLDGTELTVASAAAPPPLLMRPEERGDVGGDPVRILPVDRV